MQNSSSLPPTLRFGVFELDPRTGELRKKGMKIRLQGQPVDILVMLLQRPGEAVTREELQKRLWPADTFVDFEQGLNNAMKRLRAALDDAAESPHFIETVPRRGYRFVGAVNGAGQTVTRQRGFFARRWKPIAAAAGVVTVLLLVALFWLARTKKVPETARMTPSIAVLPFVDLSPEKDQEYFSDGLAEELLNSLVKMQGLHVAARTSSFQFKGKNEDLRVIGQRLNVATVLEGSVRKQGQRVRISAQLIQVSDGFHLWSEVYDRDLTDIFVVQEEIARSVAGSLKVTLLGEKPRATQATSAEAYNAYLQGQYFHEQSSYRPDYEQRLEKAIAYYEEAIKLDPNYAPSWAALAWALEERARMGRDPDPLDMEKDFSKGREAAERALALDPNLAAAYTAMGSIKQYYDWDWAGADACYQRALVLEPGNADIIGSAASLAATLNRFEEALRLSRRAVELDPLQARKHFVLAYRAWWAGRLDEAAAAGKKASELNPDLHWLHSVLGRVYLAQSHPQEALVEAERETWLPFRLQGRALAYHALARNQESDRALAELIAKYKKVGAFQVAEVYAFREETDAAFTWIEQAYVQHESGLPYIKGDPLLKSLERDPRYAAFLKKMRLPASTLRSTSHAQVNPEAESVLRRMKVSTNMAGGYPAQLL